MAIKPLNSVAGFSVGETPSNIILANGDITTTNITTTGVSNLNSIGNVKISGGTNGQVIQTDGSGNLSFVTISTSGVSNGSNSGIFSSGAVPFAALWAIGGGKGGGGATGGNINLGSNTLTLVNAAATFAGNISGTGNLILTNGTQTLTGANSYTGTTNITGGYLVIGTGGNIANSSPSVIPK